MPYTKEELKAVDSYQDFVNELRNKYLDRISELKAENFRRNNILYSFEDIVSTNGLETADVGQRTLYNKIDLDGSDLEKLKSTSSNNYPLYVSTVLLEKTIRRDISELATSQFALSLPTGIRNGDVVTSDNFEDDRVYLIDNNQKKIFSDKGVFYVDYDVTKLKTVAEAELNAIPEGDEVQ